MKLIHYNYKGKIGTGVEVGIYNGKLVIMSHDKMSDQLIGLLREHVENINSSKDKLKYIRDNIPILLNTMKTLNADAIKIFNSYEIKPTPKG